MSSPPVPFPSARDRLAFALDVDGLAEAERWASTLAEEVGVFKVGLELFVAAGPAAVEAVQRRGAACFLDLKLHDIPATVAGAVRSASRLGVRYLTVHAGGGPAMLRAAVEAAGPGTTLLAVTVLTSMDEAELAALGETRSARTLVVDRARLAVQAGVRGLVCSPEECAAVRAAVGPEIALVVPGIRPAGASLGDQKRVGTPAEAIRSGADVLVVGRPIRQAAEPVAAARSIVDEIAAARRS
jgi:orotidine-5'-phosphate decarboxylase